MRGSQILPQFYSRSSLRLNCHVSAMAQSYRLSITFNKQPLTFLNGEGNLLITWQESGIFDYPYGSLFARNFYAGLVKLILQQRFQIINVK